MDAVSYIMGKASGGGGGGTKNYNALNNKPQINGVELSGNKTASDLGLAASSDIEHVQVSTMPVASADNLGKIVQFVGATDTYTNGYFYKCVENDGVYSWEAINVQAGGGSSNTFNEDDFVVENDEVSLAPAQRTFTGTTAEWEALTSAKKALYSTVQLTDDDDSNYKDVYSTSEVKTNKVWVDGKPIYRKVVDFGTLPNTTQKDVPMGITYDWIVSVIGMARRSTDGAFLHIPDIGISGSSLQAYSDNVFVTGSGDLRVTSGVDRTTFYAYFVVEYTKTTD